MNTITGGQPDTAAPEYLPQPEPQFLPGFSLLDGTTLKIIALVSMIIDHIGASVLYFVLAFGDIADDSLWETLLHVYNISRGVGRTSFPIYCFLIVEGFYHTHNAARYVGRLFIFSLISEIPFDLAFFTYESVSEPNLIKALLTDLDTVIRHQNVFFTHTIGLLTIIILDRLRKRFSEDYALTIFSGALTITAGALLAHVMCTDYAEYGVLLIVITYILHDMPVIRNAAGMTFIALAIESERWAFPGFILTLLYNGKRGRTGRWSQLFFYVVYPLHLIILYYIRCVLFMI